MKQFDVISFRLLLTQMESITMLETEKMDRTKVYNPRAREQSPRMILSWNKLNRNMKYITQGRIKTLRSRDEQREVIEATLYVHSLYGELASLEQCF